MVGDNPPLAELLGVGGVALAGNLYPAHRLLTRCQVNGAGRRGNQVHHLRRIRSAPPAHIAYVLINIDALASGELRSQASVTRRTATYLIPHYYQSFATWDKDKVGTRDTLHYVKQSTFFLLPSTFLNVPR